MNHWDTLGIAKTNDQKIIRKAYATALKRIDQELEPEQFIALRAAFEHAKDEASRLESDDLLLNEDTSAAHTNPIHEIDIAYVSSENHSMDTAQDPIQDPTQDIMPLHQRGFEFLMHAIQQQNSHIDLRTELRDYTHYLLNLEPVILSHEQVQAYLQQLHDACIAADLNGLNDFLNLNPDQDLVASKASSERFENTPVPLLNPELQFRAELDEVSQQLWEETFNDQVFEQFMQVLAQWQHQTLDQQMAAYDQLNHVLGSINSTSLEPKRFFQVWYDYFGNEMPPASADPSSHQLYDRLQALVKINIFWQQVPTQYVKPIQTLQNNERFQPFQMLTLLLSFNSLIQSLRKNNWYGIPDLVEPERNTNFHLLRLWSQWLRFLPLQIVFSLLCMLIAGVLFDTTSSFTFGMILPLSLLYFPVILSPILAKSFASVQRDMMFLRLTSLFYLSISILALLSPLINTAVMAILLSSWVVLTTVVMGYALYFYRNIFDDLKEIIHIQADKFFVYLGFALVLMIIGFILFAVQAIQPFGILFALLPMSLILCPDYFKNFFSELFKRPGDFIVSLLALFKSSGLVVGVVVIYATLSLMAGSADAKTLPDYINLPLALMMVSSFWLAFLSGKGISYICKYLSYFVTIIVSIQTIVLPLLFGYYLYHTAKVDRQLKKAQS